MAEGSRLICRSERPHPGARFTILDEHGYRYTRVLTDLEGNDTAQLGLRHRGRARVEDSIRYEVVMAHRLRWPARMLGRAGTRPQA